MKATLRCLLVWMFLTAQHNAGGRSSWDVETAAALQTSFPATPDA